MPETPPQQTIDEFVGASHGDLPTVRRLLNAYPSIVSLPASWGEFAIQAAAQTGQVEIAEMLLASGVPLDICTASMLGRLETVNQLLQTDPSLAGATGAHGLPVMYHAAVRANIAVAEALVSHGADINAGRGKNTALHGAITFGQAEMTAWLISHGADLTALDYQGLTPLALAQKLKRQKIISFLETHAATG